MPTLTRKQRELQEREGRILAAARPLLLREGYHGLNMDRIAEQLEYSKGTIYNHFNCKEEIIIALAIETLQRRTEMFERAAAFRGLPRERMAAIGMAAELFVKLYAEHFRVEQVIRSSSIWEKTSEKRRSIMRACETRCIGMLAGIVRDAVARDDLALPAGTTPEQLVFGLWSLSYGAYSIIADNSSLDELGISDPYAAVRQNLNLLIDGYHWKPLSPEHDYDAIHKRIESEVFAEEIRAVSAS